MIIEFLTRNSGFARNCRCRGRLLEPVEDGEPCRIECGSRGMGVADDLECCRHATVVPPIKIFVKTFYIDKQCSTSALPGRSAFSNNSTFTPTAAGVDHRQHVQYGRSPESPLPQRQAPVSTEVLFKLANRRGPVFDQVQCDHLIPATGPWQNL